MIVLNNKLFKDAKDDLIIYCWGHQIKIWRPKNSSLIIIFYFQIVLQGCNFGKWQLKSLIITGMFQRLPNKLKLMISTCKCYPTRDRSPRLDCASPPFSTKSSALPAHPVIENSCSKPSGFVNVQVSTQSFSYNGRFHLLIDLVVSTEWFDNSRVVYSMLYLEIVKNYDQSFS